MYTVCGQYGVSFKQIGHMNEDVHRHDYLRLFVPDSTAPFAGLGFTSDTLLAFVEFGSQSHNADWIPFGASGPCKPAQAGQHTRQAAVLCILHHIHRKSQQPILLHSG